MSIHCVNYKSKQVKDLADQLGVSPLVAAAKIAVWQDINGLDKFPTLENLNSSNQVNYTLKAIDILSSDKAKQVFEKGNKNNWSLDKILSELQIPKEQKELILDIQAKKVKDSGLDEFIKKSFNKDSNFNDEEISKIENYINKNNKLSIDDILLDLASNYSYSVEINIAKGGKNEDGFSLDDHDDLTFEDKYRERNGKFYSVSIYTRDLTEISEEEYNFAKQSFEDNKREFENSSPNSSYYSNLTVPGGTNYTENEIITPGITPSIKGHAQFATDNGIGWFRSDNKEEFTSLNTRVTEEEMNQLNSKTRRILEVQSDLFQKGRNKKDLVNRDDEGVIQFSTEFANYNIQGNTIFITHENGYSESFSIRNLHDRNLEEQNLIKFKIEEYKSNSNFNKKENQFLQLLNENNNWVTFFVKSIIQDSAKKGYEKVLFPTGNTASKVEGHATLEEFKKQKEDRIKELEKQKNNKDKSLKEYNDNPFGEYSEKEFIENIDNEINQLKQELERVETEGFGALKPIYNFYENTVTNILKKQGYNPTLITDEYGNSWNEIKLKDFDKKTIYFQKNLNDLLDSKIKEEIFNVSENDIDENFNFKKDYSSINNKVFFNLAPEKTIHLNKGLNTVNDVLFNILNNDDLILSDNAKVLFKKALKLFDKSGAKVLVLPKEKFDKLPGNIGDALMVYYESNNTICMYEESFKTHNTYTLLKAFIHEISHSTTVHIFKNPKTFEEKEFKDLIVKAFNLYKEKNDKFFENANKSYGFTNELEFIAELYSNPSFQEEIKNIELLNKSFFELLINAIRRLFGLSKTKANNDFISATFLIKQIEDQVEKDNSGFNGSVYKNFTTDTLFFKEQKEKQNYYKLDDIDKKLDKTLNSIKDSIEQNLGKYNVIKKKLKDDKKQKVEHYTDSLQKLLEDLNSYSSADRWKAVTTYVNSLVKNIDSLKIKFKAEDFSDKDMLSAIRMYSNYLNSYSLIDDIINLIGELKTEKNPSLNDEEITEISNNLEKASGAYKVLQSGFQAVLRSALKNQLADPKYITEIETKWKQKLSKEHEALKIKEPKTTWIAKQMNTVYKDQIQEEVQNYVNNLIDSPAFDITSATMFFNSAINTNSKLITIFQTMLDEIRNNIIKRSQEKDFVLEKLFKKLVESKENSNLNNLYENIIEYDNDLPILKGKYSIKYKQDKEKVLKELETVKKEKGKNSKDYKNLKKKLDSIDYKNYENDFSKLSEIEKEVLKEFTDIIDSGHKITFGIQSLKKYFRGVNYYSLPSITKSDLERVLEGDSKGILKDKWTDLTQIKTDDIGYDYSEKNIDIAGNPVYNLKINYRGNISGKDQSLDLFTLFRLEHLNTISYQEKHNKEMELNAIVEIAKNKEYYRTEGIKIPIISRYANRNKLNLKEGYDSNTYKRLQSLLESNIYDISNKYSGNLGPVDINKAIKVVNGMSAQISLALNTFSATANVINGNAQLFLEAISKNTINASNIKKAEKIYLNDFANNMKDLGSPIKKSFTNQLVTMFDTYGLISVGNQAFIKNNLLKTFSDPHTLQFMHEGGEHWMQSVLTMSVLDSVKVMNENNDFIDKNGKITDSEKNAASLLDMLYLHPETGKLEMNDKVVYTTHTLITKYNEGGKEHINSLIKKKIFDTMGNYDANMQPEAMRHWWGKMILMFRRFLIPIGISRFRGFANSLKSNEEIQEDPERYMSYSHSLKDYEEGMYTSFVRYVKYGLLPSIKNLQLSLSEDYWKTLSDSQKGNIKKAITEIALTSIMLPLLRTLLLAIAEGLDDDDDDYLYTVLYQTRRLESELAQYRNISENFKLLKSPIPASRVLETCSNIIYKTIQPWTWDDEIKSGKRKGDLKYFREWEKLIPVINKVDLTAEDLYKYQDSMFGLK